MVNAVFQEIERKLVNGFIKNSLFRFSVQLDILKVLLLKKELKLLVIVFKNLSVCFFRRQDPREDFANFVALKVILGS